MNMPGFTAMASLYKIRAAYREAAKRDHAGKAVHAAQISVFSGVEDVHSEIYLPQPFQVAWPLCKYQLCPYGIDPLTGRLLWRPCC
jgi:hypothetical protein